MGGSDSRYYRHFRTYCCEAYNILRKSATLILSLFHLMAGAAIPDVRQDPEKAMLKLQVCLSYHIANPSHQRPFSCSLLCWPQVLGRSCSSCRFALHVVFNPAHHNHPPPPPLPHPTAVTSRLFCPASLKVGTGYAQAAVAMSVAIGCADDRHTVLKKNQCQC